MDGNSLPNSRRRSVGGSGDDFHAITSFIEKKYGIQLPDTKRTLVQSRLARRLSALNLDTITEYRRFLDSPAGEEEQEKLLSALTTNVTHFFREMHHFDYIRDKLMPRLTARARSGGKVRLWSAGCSSGMEPYSLGMTLLENMPNLHRLDVKILATDIDSEILATAADAIYTNEEIEGVPQTLRRKYLSMGPQPGTHKVRDEVTSLVTFGRLNLVEDLPFRGPFDVIFCRNVTIYFDKATQQDLWRRMLNVMAPDGVLCIGHSERVSGIAAQKLQSDGPTVYIPKG